MEIIIKGLTEKELSSLTELGPQIKRLIIQSMLDGTKAKDADCGNCGNCGKCVDCGCGA